MFYYWRGVCNLLFASSCCPNEDDCGLQILLWVCFRLCASRCTWCEIWCVLKHGFEIVCDFVSDFVDSQRVQGFLLLGRGFLASFILAFCARYIYGVCSNTVLKLFCDIIYSRSVRGFLLLGKGFWTLFIFYIWGFICNMLCAQT